MDTRQLSAFCAVVERRSFSQAAEQLGVTQPAVSLQVRSLEKRLGLQLLDRSGRRVEPTEAGRRLYRSAQRLLALEEQLLAELGEEVEGELTGRLELGHQESARSAVLAGHGVTFISRSAIEADLAAGTVAVARVEGLEPAREIMLVRSAGRAETRVAQAFVAFARERLA
jgi:DNA-binding transcriptional LysR family regulator